MGQLVIGLGSLTSVTCAVITVIQSRKQHASKEELDAVEKRVEAKHSEISHKIDQLAVDREMATNLLRSEIRSLNASVNSSLQDNARAIGRLEGSHDLANQIADAIKR